MTSARLPISDYRDAARAGQLMLVRCEECHAWHFYPRPACPKCGGSQLAWRAASGRGEVYSYSVVHRAPSPEFQVDLPYVIAMVTTSEGPRMMARLTCSADQQLHIGAAVRIDAQASREWGLPVFGLADTPQLPSRTVKLK